MPPPTITMLRPWESLSLLLPEAALITVEIPIGDGDMNASEARIIEAANKSVLPHTAMMAQFISVLRFGSICLVRLSSVSARFALFGRNVSISDFGSISQIDFRTNKYYARSQILFYENPSTMALMTATRGSSKFTVIRKASAPYLPPPLLRLIHATDTYFHVNHGFIATDYCHDEPSMVILSSFFLAYVLWHFAKGAWASATKRSTAHLSGEDDTILGGLVCPGHDSRRKRMDRSSTSREMMPSFQETVVLFGATNSGKTTLLHYLCDSKGKDNAWDPPMTVTSLVANVGYVCPWEDASDNGVHGNMTIRVIDYPGHPSLSSQLTTLLLPTALSRLIFTLDATQPVADGAALLYQFILTHAQVRQSWSKIHKSLVILVVCTKTDIIGSKNYKRMKIQLRNELEKLRKVDLMIYNGSKTTNDNEADMDDAHSKVMLHVEGKSIDLDNLGSDVPVSLHFVESGFGMRGLDAVREFVWSGKLPSVK